jgi:murein L,D-transpeptidase YafK
MPALARPPAPIPGSGSGKTGDMRYLLLSFALALLPSCGGKAEEQPEETELEKPADERMKEELGKKDLELGSPVFIRTFKEERELELFVENKETGKFELFRTYPIAAASGTLGPKLAEGDRQVPEGFYFVGPGAMNPNSAFHLSFNIGYPNEYDRANGRTGSFIMVHGNSVSIGCLAMTDEKIEEIYAICGAAHEGGQPFFRVHIFPFRMTDERMAAAVESEWIDFWKNLKTGYDLFEKNRIPPNVTVKDKDYAFE